MAYIITEACIDIKDKACIEECPVDCIYEGGRMSYINPTECIDCGACEPVCPVNAIYSDSLVPKSSVVFIDINKSFFNDIGNPGGASTINMISKDSNFIKEYNK